MILIPVTKFLRKEFKQIMFINLNLIDIPCGFLQSEKKRRRRTRY